MYEATLYKNTPAYQASVIGMRPEITLPSLELSLTTAMGWEVDQLWTAHTPCGVYSLRNQIKRSCEGPRP
jgi:hypothetical protein